MKRRGLDVERKSRHIWAAVWVEDEGLAGLFQDLALKRKCLAYDIYQIIEKAKEDRVLRMGGRLKANADVEPTMPCTTLYTAEWHSLWNKELEEKLCHAAAFLVDREGEIEAKWQASPLVIRLDDGGEEDIPAHLEEECLERSTALSTLFSDTQSYGESNDEWDGALSSGYESEFKPRTRKRRKKPSKRST
jgi:hypothetical protein